MAGRAYSGFRPKPEVKAMLSPGRFVRIVEDGRQTQLLSFEIEASARSYADGQKMRLNRAAPPRHKSVPLDYHRRRPPHHSWSDRRVGI
jgi:hypothetical protein